MSVNSYLTDLSSKLVLSSTEKENIKTSINALSKNLNLYFNDGELHDHFQFGSSTRGTILPRKVDSESDVDYMIIFKNPNGYKPETLLNYLKQFMHKYYSRSEIHKDSPTMVLELNHIKFELVPAMQDRWGDFLIPAPSNYLYEWMLTDPSGFDKDLTNANVHNNYKIKPLIRLMKYWNTNKANRHHSSYELEKMLVGKYYYFTKPSLKEYVYDSIEGLSYSLFDSQTYRDKLTYAKNVISNCRSHEFYGRNAEALKEIKKLFPEI
ncbi:nucleotidyltransferase [Bacillus sonorensis]|uniref:SMODS domain-containing nucleotidyltransferase n=1 Tax=Bacillus sonorensis TaxID=119858 RepID=UPI00228173AB|nr:nucleotidyltransferase [Bacillus sonorensis]MCY8087232.1 nucleotidyltransferase [Bacillus sonorensis]MCZ0069550.1 nucleotidyltransferase [Bacillus sonorensis]MCZ0096939.1 nucleotidyltransferase [Bacillus sonorensis]MEC1517617.1 nucleotidyltransferase [Bacillus sonorensis]